MIAFETKLDEEGIDLAPCPIEVLQINMGWRCNNRCRHCHVSAGPHRSEVMSVETADTLLAVVERHAEIGRIDLTGGAPELCPEFRRFVRELRRLDRTVLVRHNLTVQQEPGQEDLPEFFAEQKVEVHASLPYYLERQTDRMRGPGVFCRSISGLNALNEVGFGKPDTGLLLYLIVNPLGTFLASSQEDMERDFREYLGREYGIEFTGLHVIINMPIGRFRERLEEKGRLQEYYDYLADRFTPGAAESAMCRTLISVRWDGVLYDCDFNQMLDLPLGGKRHTVDDLDAILSDRPPIVVKDHCYGCTAGAGSSCGGATAEG